MTATQNSDAEPRRGDVVVRLRVAEYDRLAKARGATTVVAAAALHELPRTTLFDYRSGRKTPHLPTAMRMANDLGVPVEAIFELRRPGTAA